MRFNEALPLSAEKANRISVKMKFQRIRHVGAVLRAANQKSLIASGNHTFIYRLFAAPTDTMQGDTSQPHGL